MLATMLARMLLVALFLPFSAADKLLNFRGAVGQAREVAPGAIAVLLILAGLGVEILGSLAVLTGIIDRPAGLVMAGYCGVTALMWKQFWKPGDFWTGSDSKGRQLFWDFLKNFALAGGFLMVTLGSNVSTAQDFLKRPLTSSHPYRFQTGPIGVAAKGAWNEQRG